MHETTKKPAIRFAGFTDDWEQREFKDIVDRYEDLVSTPREGYTRLGIRSHAKGTFHNFVEKGKELGTAQMHIVAAGNFIVNITFGWEHAVAITDENDAGKLVSHRFPQYSFHDDMVPEFFRYVIVDEKFRHHLWLASPGGAGRNRVLNLNEMLTYQMTLPNNDEQEKISKLFRELDNLITLHQRKYEKLLNIKKAMLEKVFPKIGEKIPEIRFSGFTDDWEQRKLSDVLTGLQNNTLSRAELSLEKGVALNVHYGDVLIKFGELLNVKKEVLPTIIDASIIAKYKASVLQNGDIIVADTAEDETVGKCSEISGLTNEIALSGLHTIPYRPQFKFALGYLGYYLNSDSYHHQLLPLMQGIKVTSISRTAMQNTTVCYPKAEVEQEHISTYFQRLDNLITLHQRKLEKLKNLKKAFLEKMFV